MTPSTPASDDDRLKQLRQQLHEFAVSYHVESVDGRNADLDYMMKLIAAHLRAETTRARIDELQHFDIRDEIEDWQDKDIYKVFTVDIPMRLAALEKEQKNG